MDDTIAAISTPAGEGGIGIIRVSGPGALAVAGKVFTTRHTPPGDLPTHTIHHGHALHPGTGDILDEALLLVMLGPHSFTGEDVVEIQCHGGWTTTSLILEAALEAGARLASPGEFTRRAFLNGRLDLAQAESVIEIIRARTEAGQKAALSRLSGGLSAEIRRLKNVLMDLVAGTEASLDHEEEEIEAPDPEALAGALGGLSEEIRGLLEKSREGSLYQDGLKAVIIGRPNVGKSSLFNALLEEERAIVTPLPGTTRDIIGEYIAIRGIPVKIVDSAGIREAGCEIEMEGVRRSLRELTTSPVVIMVLDSSQGITPEDRRIFKMFSGKKALIALNKCDLPGGIDREEANRAFPGRGVISMSCLTHQGLEELREALYRAATSGLEVTGSPEVTANIRHRDVLRRSADLLSKAVWTLEAGLALDAAAGDMRLALEALGEITGETATEDILDAVFSNFCIGK